MHNAPPYNPSLFITCSRGSNDYCVSQNPPSLPFERWSKLICSSSSFTGKARSLCTDSISKWSLSMSSEIGQDTSQWYVVHTNPKQEERADSNLRAWGVETLHPKLKTRRFNEFTGAPTVTTKPLFPRYIFAKFNAREQLAKISFTRGVHYVVSFGG